MSRYRLRDAWLLPGLLSLSRVPLAAAFAAFAHRPWSATAVLLSAAGTDVLDGYVARRFGLSTPTGAVLDPVTDKLFVLAAVGSLVGRGMLAPADLVRLVTRELGELALVPWLVATGREGAPGDDHPRANRLGKLATVLQFLALVAAVHRSRWLEWALWSAAIGGMLAAAGYWHRALRRAPRRPG